MTEAARTSRIDVRVSPDEKKNLQTKATAAGYIKVLAYPCDVGWGVEVKESIPPELLCSWWASELISIR